jgi:carbon monoxide dehydrogenase subunit G
MSLAVFSVSMQALCATEDATDVDALLTPKVIARLAEGEIVLLKHGAKAKEGATKGGGVAMVLINRPKEEVWACLEDAEAFPKFMPRVLSATCYRREGDNVGLKYKVKILYMKITYHILECHERDKGVISWTIDKTKKNGIRETTGRWILKAHDLEKTLVAYTVHVDTGLWVPKAIERALTTSDLPGVVEALKKRVESGGEYVK